MAYYSANKPNKTVAIHKEGCQKIPKDVLSECGCVETGEQGNQQWFCEKDVSAKKIDEFMNHRHWAFILCDVCWGDN
jgi:hypothetical protein